MLEDRDLADVARESGGSGGGGPRAQGGRALPQPPRGAEFVAGILRGGALRGDGQPAGRGQGKGERNGQAVPDAPYARLPQARVVVDPAGARIPGQRWARAVTSG